MRFLKRAQRLVVASDSLNRRTSRRYLPAISTLPRATKTRARAEAGSKKQRSYKPLPTQFRRERFNYRQIAREGDAAIYEQTWSGCSSPSVCYEVVRICRREGFQIDGRFVESAEVYPNSEAWGVDGFTLT
jgi:hypothetical protein